MSPLSKLEERVAADVFKADVRRWAEQIGVEPKEIHLRPMKRKWASASSAGRLTFDTDLLTEPPEKRAEVIVHELVHLKIGNHGPLFRSLVRAHLAHPMGLTSEEHHGRSREWQAVPTKKWLTRRHTRRVDALLRQPLCAARRAALGRCGGELVGRSTDWGINVGRANTSIASPLARGRS